MFTLLQLSFVRAKCLSKNGASVALTYQGEALKKRVEPLAQSINSDILLPCDVADSKSRENVFKTLEQKWGIIDCLIIHRYGNLDVNSKIVLVSCFSEHRKDSFESCNFIMDYLKKDAPFWKNEFYDKKNEWLINTN